MAITRRASRRPTGPPARVYKATQGNLGRVHRGVEITPVEAVAERGAGRDIVVCGDDLAANRALARAIEAQVGPYKPEPPHKYLGPFALPHFQPDPRPPAGHSFYETPKLKAAKLP
jgi:hypothetical protein